MANECTPLFRPGKDITCQTTGAVTGKKFVDISSTRDASTGLIKVAAPTAAGKVFGVAAYDAASGARVSVIRGTNTIVPVVAGANVTAGDEVQVNASGEVIPLAAGKAVGRAIETKASGADVFVTLY